MFPLPLKFTVHPEARSLYWIVRTAWLHVRIFKCSNEFIVLTRTVGKYKSRQRCHRMAEFKVYTDRRHCACVYKWTASILRKPLDNWPTITAYLSLPLHDWLLRWPLTPGWHLTCLLLQGERSYNQYNLKLNSYTAHSNASVTEVMCVWKYNLCVAVLPCMTGNWACMAS